MLRWISWFCAMLVLGFGASHFSEGLVVASLPMLAWCVGYGALLAASEYFRMRDRFHREFISRKEIESCRNSYQYAVVEQLANPGLRTKVLVAQRATRFNDRKRWWQRALRAAPWISQP